MISDKLGYRRLIAWQISDKLAWEVYSVSDKFPKDELFGLTSQLRRSSLSVPLNIIEGYSRFNKNEFRNFLRISLGSLAEMGYLLDFAHRRNYLSDESFKKLITLKEDCGKVLWKLMRSQ